MTLFITQKEGDYYETTNYNHCPRMWGNGKPIG